MLKSRFLRCIFIMFARLYAKKKRLLFYGILASVCLLMLWGFLGLMAALSDLLTLPGAVLLFLLAVTMLIRLAIRVLLFPGSCWLWRRTLEIHFLHEFAKHGYNRVRDLEDILATMINNPTTRQKRDCAELTIHSNFQLETTRVKQALQTYISVFSRMSSEGTINAPQTQVLDNFKDLKNCLESIQLTLPKKSICSLWEWLDYSDEIKYEGEFLKENSNFEFVHKARSILEELRSIFAEACNTKGISKKLKRFFKCKLLGTSDHMRADLLERYKAEQTWLVTEDNIELDGVWIPANPPKPNSPTVLICNPNAGFYEFAYFQSEWLDFYTQQGINLFMWNYRGYSRSRGNPSSHFMKKDGEAIVQYLKRVRGVRRLGVHGESLGGLVASHLARCADIEFVFADRTFSSIEEVALNNFGWVAYWVFKLFTKPIGSVADDFISAKCYKILSADPFDTMITDFASLKSGVAVNSIKQKSIPSKLSSLKSLCHILSDSEYSSLVSHLQSLNNLCCFFTTEEKSSKPSSTASTSTPVGVSQYQLLGRETENEDVTLYNIGIRVHNMLENLDAGGKPLLYVIKDKNSLKSMKIWVMCLEVWGSVLPINSSELEDSRLRSAEKLKSMLEELSQLHREYEYLQNPRIQTVCKSIKESSGLLTKVLTALEDSLSDGSSSDSQTSSLNIIPETPTSGSWPGFLIPLCCGHSGPYNIQERLLYEAHLTRIGFIC